MLKMSPELFLCLADQTDHFADDFILKKVEYVYINGFYNDVLKNIVNAILFREVHSKKYDCLVV